MPEIQGAKKTAEEKYRYGKDEGADFTREHQGAKAYDGIYYYNRKTRIGLEGPPLREVFIGSTRVDKEGENRKHAMY